jgi:hypothetical protein
MAMNIVEDHSSPDRILRLIVMREDDGEVVIGFEGYAWHTHGDILASISGLPEDEAVRRFVDDIIRDHQIIAVSRVNGQVRDVWPTDDPQSEFEHKPPEEALEFRRWSGLTVPVELN